MKKILKTVFHIVTKLFTFAIIGLVIFVFASVIFVGKNDKGIFGYKFFVVLSDSMAATDFEAGDLIITKEVDPATLEAGDIITFISQNPENFGEVVTHKIRSLTVDEGNNPGFVTYGTTSDVNDATIVTYPYILGQYQTNIPNVGSFITFMKTTPGYICCILIPFMLIILLQLKKVLRAFRAYKAEKDEEQINEIVKKEAAEKEKMQAEIDALKKQLAASQVVTDDSSTKSEDSKGE